MVCRCPLYKSLRPAPRGLDSLFFGSAWAILVTATGFSARPAAGDVMALSCSAKEALTKIKAAGIIGMSPSSKGRPP